ncbi:MAG: LacI family DNA-binding transcriptional regulator [Deltaproteobacteria bacterium]|nr:LacI family DNA-binding transcriptional regulator [Deltaproteobacteria bacterium]MBW2121383.1 LacI family DNA-binding transcriptional regulator [Deltaproteobacteria bacterium]
MKRRGKSVNIKDVARRAAVAPCTVSRVLGNSALVSPETRLRVFAAIEELNYRPNFLARSLAKGRTHTIGVVTANVQNSFFPELIRSIEDAAYERGFSVTISNTYNQPEKEERYVNLFIEKRFDGVILTNARSGDDSLARMLMESNIPFLFLNRYVRNFPGDYVVSDEYRGGYLAGRHLCELGHKAIAVIIGPEYSSASQGRLVGFLTALAHHGVSIRKELMRRGDLSFKSGYELMRELISTGLTFDALFGGNDMMAMGAIDALLENGLRVPEDVSVIGYDDIEFSGRCQGVGLTTVRQFVDLMGKRAVEILTEKIEHQGSRRPQRIVFPVELIVRGTTRKRGPHDGD